MSDLRFDHLTKQFGPITALDDLTVTVQPARITGLLGANGAGKSTTLRILLGLTAATRGTATINGQPYHRLREPSRTIGALLDPTGFHPRRNGRDTLRVLAALCGASDGRIDEVLNLVGLDTAARRNVGGYSTGMRQRLGLAAALLADPATLVLDEPANGLDPSGVRWLRTLLRRLADEGRTVLISSHQLAELQHTVDDVILLDRGRLITAAPIADLLNARGGQQSLEDAFFHLTTNGASS
jgi:ABC-2 type transport system ATP-binding protein